MDRHLCVLFFAVIIQLETGKGLSPEGCDDNWIKIGFSCYMFEAVPITFHNAEQACRKLDSHLTSIWSEAEFKALYKTVWNEHLTSRSEFSWIGFKNSKHKDKTWMDGSKWDYNNTGKISIGCEALWGYGSITSMNCDFHLPAFICKKPLTRVFTTDSLENTTALMAIQHSGTQINKVQLFTQLLPPFLTSIPGNNVRLGHTVIDTEVDCAMRCFTIKPCLAFMMECRMSTQCKDYTCTLLSDVH